jgi:endonuclease-3
MSKSSGSVENVHGDMNESFRARRDRARRIVAYLKKTYPAPKSELRYKTPFQFLVAVVLSAQCTDKKVNAVTDALFKKYTTPADFAKLDPAAFARELSSITYFNTKARHLVAAAQKVVADFGGKVPKTERELVSLPGVGYKTAHVVMGELYDSYEGIPTDTHVKRFALRFDLTRHSDLKKISKDLEALVPKKDWKYVNNGLVLYGRYVCPARPHDCTKHPLTKIWPRAATRWPKAK